MDQQEQNKSVNQPPQEEIIAELTEVKETSTPEQESPKKPKSKKALIWCLSILTVIALATAAVFAYLYFTNQNNKNEATTETETAEQTNEPTVEETEITDTYILRDLDEKMAILHDTAQTDAAIDKGVVGGYSENILNMYKNGDLSPTPIRIAYVINSLESQFRHLNTEETNAVLSKIQPEYIEEASRIPLKGIDGDVVAKKYKDVFGEEVSQETSDSCYAYEYESTHNFYYKNPIGGCGGASPYRTMHYKSKYTTSGEKAYVYVSTALLDGEKDKIYCDISYLDLSGPFSLSDDIKECAQIQPLADFILNESNYRDFAQYRFVFNKADDGTYYFDKVEKL